ncbi:hypothetical protein NLB58_02190 [Porphyromonas gingivalis]|uniref:hypothetical protein n=1 Tax=Porphyromonas gingivalis TaxID=837 RepID=UPI002657D2CE|nr:hypothetical protein [Porphyromonas gingivalis]MDP0530686.1 hypothetical protein [Porphyromonas gingivalis]MDP0625628.1 hypothetical protein [Porphyromonas gingivalis]WKD51749.1 hypothetical protein NF669_05540 [Porphyromonas gingivalis]WKD53797.1 hypothetical protein NF668_05545 [Porphyromonas gingivalis]
MEDKSIFANSQSKEISEGLQNFIDSMVEEIILEGKPFDTQKKYLKKFSEKEGVYYEAIEKSINELVETMREMKTSDSKMLIKLALIQAKEAHVTETAVLSIAQQIGQIENDAFSVKRKALAGIIQSLQIQSAKNEYKNLNNEGGKVTKLPKYEYVDLGLPSGTLWATFNVGATKPEEFGDYFAWGETTPKTTYNWETYKHCIGAPDQLIKYCGKSKSGYKSFTDKLSILQPSDDAATANWGEEWRMPIEDEWDELRENTSSIWTTLNGVKGMLFTARNGNTLFLPAAGNREGNTLRCDDEGLYWSSTYPYWMKSQDSRLASYVSICPGAFCTSRAHNRSVGLSVRPVRLGTGIAARQTPKGGLRGILSSFLRHS